MKAVVDDKIPFIELPLRKLMDEVVFLPGREITAEAVREADVLIVRTRTRVDRQLLEGSRVRFVATATIGYDHLDTAYLENVGVRWTNCPGCNATSVAQYVRNSLLLWCRATGKRMQDLTVGIVGVGHVGTAVREVLAPFGCQLLLNDPPREAQEGNDNNIRWTPIAELREKCDVITLHTPLAYGGRYATCHLVDEDFLREMKRRPLLINAARGGVVDELALERAVDDGHIAQAVVDTWEGEPELRRSLLDKVFIGTPHIAGYSADGKANATRMVLQALCQWMEREMTFDIQAPALPSGYRLPTDPVSAALALYNPMTDSQRLKGSPETFEQQRGNYPLRRESV